MKVIEYPSREDWKEILSRPSFDVTTLFDTVRTVIDNVIERGDEAVKELEEKFDKVLLTTLEVTAAEFDEAEKTVDADLKEAILMAHGNIEKFHKAQTFEKIVVQTQKGVTCEQRSVPIEKVGLYVPGGTAPLFSTVLMLATPARIAGCKQTVLCTPPNAQGKINPAILFAAKVSGVSKVFKIGGSQAIAAMAYGTESVPKVDKIFGPGNQYVTAAKQLVSLSDVAIDMPAGPSEVEVLADEESNPVFVAADLLSQAEHGADSQVLLVSTSKALLDDVQKQVAIQLEKLPRKALTEKSLDNSRLVLVKDIDEAVELTNAYAPEHLVLACKDYRLVAERITHAGSVFLGKYSCESAGDYASGTNHTLPTKGYAKAYSGLCLDSFVRKITFQELTADGVKSIGKAVEAMADGEQLFAHKNAMTVRLESLK